MRNIIEAVLGFAINPIQTVLYSYYCQNSGKISNHRSFNKYMLIFTFFITFLALIIQLFSTEILRTVLGELYLDAAPALGPLVLYAMTVFVFKNMKFRTAAWHVYSAYLR